MNKSQLNIAIDKPLLAELRQLSDETKISLTNIAVQALREYLPKVRDLAKYMKTRKVA